MSGPFITDKTFLSLALKKDVHGDEGPVYRTFRHQWVRHFFSAKDRLMSSVMKGIQDLQTMGKTFFCAKDRLMSSVMKGIQDIQTMGKTCLFER